MQEEHLLLEVGDIIKIKPGSGLFSVPEDVLLRVILVATRRDGERQYWLDWPGRTTNLSIFFQYGVDKYAMKLMPPDTKQAG